MRPSDGGGERRRLVEECEQLPVDLLGVGDAHHVRTARDLDVVVELDRRGVLLADGDDAHDVLLGLVCWRTSTLRPPASTAHESDDSGPSVDPTCGLAVSGSGSWRDATGRPRAAAPRCYP